MKHFSRSLLSAALLAGLAFPWIAWRAPSPAAQDSGSAPSLAGPEHKLLEKYVGTWDAEVKAEVPGQPADVTQGKSTSRLVAGGLWLVTDFEGSLMGAPFVGHEVKGFDAHAKSYVVNWVDSMSTAMFSGHMEFDAATRTLDGMIQGHDEAGGEMKFRATDTWTDEDTHEWVMHMAGPDGQEMEALRITYRRKR